MEIGFAMCGSFCTFAYVFPMEVENYTEEYLYSSWEKMNLQFIDPDYERNTLDLEDVSFKEFGGK